MRFPLLLPITRRRMKYTPVAIILYIIFAGWILPLKRYIEPGEGIGLALGIIGSLMMLAVFSYSLRKRIKFTHKLSPLSSWFNVHIFMGIFGPILILYHSRYSLGAQNSNIALFSMLTVATSGVVGRFLYNKVKYKKLFALWHVAHLPIVYIMVLSVLFHILAFFLY